MDAATFTAASLLLCSANERHRVSSMLGSELEPGNFVDSSLRVPCIVPVSSYNARTILLSLGVPLYRYLGHLGYSRGKDRTEFRVSELYGETATASCSQGCNTLLPYVSRTGLLFALRRILLRRDRNLATLLRESGWNGWSPHPRER